MIAELDNIKDHATDSVDRRFKNGPSAVDGQFENGGHAMVDKESIAPRNSDCESPLNGSPPPLETSEEKEVEREGLADWGVVACAFLSNLIAAIDFNGFGVLYPHLVEHFESSTAAVGWCASSSGFFQSFVALFASYPIQSFGCRLPGVVGSLLFSLGISLSCFAQNLTTIYLTYGLIAGSGSGLTLLTTGIIVHQRFSRNRNLASGIGSLGFSFGGIIGSSLANQLIQSYGWRGAFLILGGIQAQRIPLCLCFRTPKRLRSHPHIASGTSPRRLSGRAILKYLKETFNFSILRQARYSVYSAACISQMFCMYGYWPHTVNRAVHVGLSRDDGVIAVTIISVMSTVTRLPVAFIANLKKVNSSLIFGAGMFAVFLSIVAIFVNTGIIGTMTSAVLFGFHLGCTVPLVSIVAVDLMGVALLPKSLAMLQFSGGLAKLTAAPLIGWVFDVTRDYNKALAIIGCLAFLAATLMFALTFAIIRSHRQKSVARDAELSLVVNGVADSPTANRPSSQK